MTAPYSSSADDGPVDAALAAYLDLMDRGEPVDVRKLLAEHPGCESELGRFLEHQNYILEIASRSLDPPDHIGQTFGDFQLVRELGRGGMGVVYEAQQLSLRRRVAVKVIARNLGSDPRNHARFRNETGVLAQLRHPHIVDVYVVGEEAGVCFYAMELIDGGDANALIDGPSPSAPAQIQGNDAKSTKPGGQSSSAPLNFGPARASSLQSPASSLTPPATPDRCGFIATIARQVADALAHAHACGVLHRDVKPSNILLDRQGRAYLSDFGLARMVGQETLTELGDFVGTLRYVAPEVVRTSTGRADERSDVYALGASLWEMLAGRRLFDGGDRAALVHRILVEEPEAPSQGRPDVPRDLETIALCALAKEPQRRYQSVELMRDDLDRFLAGRPISARRTSATERASLWAMRNPRLAATLAAATAILACVATLAAILIAGARRQTVAALAASRLSEATARQQSEAAAASERTVRSMLYSTDMALAGAAWKAGEGGRARMLLDRHAVPAPRSGADPPPFDPRGFEWRFLDRQLNPRSEVLYRGDEPLFVLARPPGEPCFVTAGSQAVVRWHDPETGRVTRSLPTHQSEISCLDFSPSGRLLATGDEEGALKIWTVDDLQLRHSLKALDRKAFYVKFLGSESRLACGGEGTTHVIVDAATGNIEQRLVGPEPPPKPANRSVGSFAAWAGSPSKWLLTTRDVRHINNGDELEVWSLADGRRRGIQVINAPSSIVCDAEEKLAYVGGREQLQVVDLESGRSLHVAPLASRGGPLLLSPDGRRLMLGTVTGEFVVWNVSPSPGKINLTLSSRLPVHESAILDAEFDAGGAAILSAGRDGAVRRTHIDDDQGAAHELSWARSKILQPIPNSDLVLVKSPLAVCDRSTGRVVRQLADDRAPLAVTVSGDGKFAASATPADVRAWNLETGQLVLHDQQPADVRHACGLTFAGDPLRLLASYWQIEGGQHCFKAFSLSGERPAIRLAPNQTEWMHRCQDGGLVFREHHPENVVCLEIPSGRVRWRRPPFADYAQRGAVTPDGRWLVAGGVDRRVLMLFDCRTGERKYRVPCDCRMTALTVAGDGRSFFVGDSDGVVSVWNLEHGQKLFDLARFDAQVDYLYATDHGLLAAAEQQFDGGSKRCWYEFEAD